MKIIKNVLLASTLFIFACQSKKSDAPQVGSVSLRTVFFDKTGMDTTVAPGDNFFLYANGNWVKNTEIPNTQTGWGSFYVLHEENTKNLNKILVDAYRSHSPEGSIEQKVGDFYHSGMDTTTIEKLGISPLEPLLNRIDSATDVRGLMNLIADGSRGRYDNLLGFSVDPDDKMSTQNIANFSQAGITLPDRSYYLDKDQKAKTIRAAYLAYIQKVFTLSGDSLHAKTDASKILALETKIAKSHSTPVELRDPEKNYHKFLVSDFQKQTPNINWTSLFKQLDINPDSILVRQPNYYKTLSALVKAEPIANWKLKLKFDALNAAASSLTKAFRDARFEFFGKTLNGQKAPTERWKFTVNSTDSNLGDLLGQLYTEQYFKPEAKKRMLSLVDNLQKVYEDRIKKVDWMSPETKEKAIEKLNAFVKKIGFPDKWKNFDDVSTSPDTYYKNIQTAKTHAFNVMINKLGKPVDKTEWDMTPPTVNAYYNPSFNEIVFPAGILQFPFFDFNADDAINYGAIGMVIGHEMTHGFDDQGRQYDVAGNLKDWWTKADADKFKAKTDKVADFYSKFSLLDNQHVNGRLTLGENLADIGGLQIAYDAFKLTEEGKSGDKINGLTPDQRFFLSFAQVWRIKTREETMRVRLKTDPHSPEMFRVNGPVYNIDAFYKAFNIPNTAKMYIAPKNRLGVW
ncbi:putative endopeptidase [Pedobacter sp. UYP30]|uniref:M13 family metallopeptidase n=1 Tax=Pedobacter sp. UYP30 TaxID=1756400 RepID=UPI003392DB8B